MATLVKIAIALGTTPNWLLGVSTLVSDDSEMVDFIERFINAANNMTKHDIELCIIQAEAIAAAKQRS
jgi:hypothetical protein